MNSPAEIEFENIEVITFVIPWWVVGSALAFCIVAAGIVILVWRRSRRH